MSLRPRYSLLTLLVLTALVTGGVKLWHGPHHTIRQPESGLEIEFRYTRDWQDAERIDGPLVQRQSDSEGQLSHVNVVYYRQGKCSNRFALIKVDAANKCYASRKLNDDCYYEQLVLTPNEQINFDAAISKEYDRLQVAGYRLIPEIQAE